MNNENAIEIAETETNRVKALLHRPVVKKVAITAAAVVVPVVTAVAVKKVFNVKVTVKANKQHTFD